MSQDSATHNGSLKFECKVHFGSSRRGRKRLVVGEAPKVAPALEGGGGRVPKVARLMALAIRLQGLVERGEVSNYAQLAAVGHVTRARVTQIMNLTLLAPDLQEEMLFLPPTLKGRDALVEHDLRPIAAEFEWAKQRRLWRLVAARAGVQATSQSTSEPTSQSSSHSRDARSDAARGTRGTRGTKATR